MLMMCEKSTPNSVHDARNETCIKIIKICLYSNFMQECYGYCREFTASENISEQIK